MQRPTEPAAAARVAECTIGGGVPWVEPLRGGGPRTFGREVERRSEVERFEMRREEQPHTHDAGAHYCGSKKCASDDTKKTVRVAFLLPSRPVATRNRFAKEAP